MLLHKGEHSAHDVITNRVGHEGQTSSGCHCNSPLLIINLFFLLGEKERQNWDGVRKSDFGKVAAQSLRLLVGSLSLSKERTSKKQDKK